MDASRAIIATTFYLDHKKIRNPPLKNHVVITWACLMLRTHCGEPMSNVPIPSHNCYLYLCSVFGWRSDWCCYSPNNKLQGSVFVIFKCGKFSAGSSECEQPCDAESNLLTCSSASISCLPWDSKTYLREEKSSPDMIIDVKWILSQICCDWVGTNHL